LLKVFRNAFEYMVGRFRERGKERGREKEAKRRRKKKS
jgi:hypothetical protein